MREIIIKTQKQFDKLPKSFKEYTAIYIKSKETIVVNKAWENSSVVASGNSSVEASGNSSVVASGNSSVVASGNSSVVAWGNSSVEAWENSSVVASGNSSVVASGNSSVVAWGNSSVEASGNSSVVAWGNSSVVAWGNSSVVAWGNSSVHLYSDYATILLFGFSVCWDLVKGKVQKKSKTATIITPKYKKGTSGWLEREGIEDKEKVIIYKKVSKDFKTQEETENETVWKIGTIVKHQNYQPKDEECGEGKFHGCSRPYFADEFRNEVGDRYIAIKVEKTNLYVWNDEPSFPHKVSFGEGKVVYECDKFGKKIK